MEDILTPEEQKRLETEGIALVKPNTFWVLPKELQKKYNSFVAFLLRNKTSGEILLLAIANEKTSDFVTKVMALVKKHPNFDLSEKEEVSRFWDYIVDPDTIQIFVQEHKTPD